MPDERQDGPFDYRLFGLALRSDFPIPELPDAPAAEPDVRICRGTADNGSVISIAGIAEFRVADGNCIWVSPAAGASPRNVRLYLLGSAMGLLLHQRGLLPLHANAVDVGGRAFAFMGPSGSGKSTLAAWFHDQGHAVLADDVCVVSFDDKGRPMVNPGLPRLRLWKQALEATGRDSARFDRSYAGDEEWDKFDVPLDPPPAALLTTPLGGVYLLAMGAEAIERLEGLEAAEALFANTYRGRFVAQAGDPRLHWEACIRLVQSTPIFRVSRPWGLQLMDAQSRRLLDHCRASPG